MMKEQRMILEHFTWNNTFGNQDYFSNVIFSRFCHAHFQQTQELEPNFLPAESQNICAVQKETTKYPKIHQNNQMLDDCKFFSLFVIVINVSKFITGSQKTVIKESRSFMEGRLKINQEKILRSKKYLFRILCWHVFLSFFHIWTFPKTL